MSRPGKMRTTFLYCEYSKIFKVSFKTFFVRGGLPASLTLLRCQLFEDAIPNFDLHGLHILEEKAKYHFPPNATGDSPNTVDKIIPFD